MFIPTPSTSKVNHINTTYNLQEHFTIREKAIIHIQKTSL